jgi:hypothetical protein
MTGNQLLASEKEHPAQSLPPIYFLTHGRSDVDWGNWLADAGIGVTVKHD